MLNLTQLASFVVVAEELNFRKAALRLYLTQPALSRQVRLLEESLGVELFTRTRRGVHLTAAGSLLLGEARNLLASAQRLQNMIGQESDGSGTLVIAVSTGIAERILHVGLQFQKCHPKIDLVYREVSSTAQNLALHGREIDVGFLRAPVNPAYLVSEPLFMESLVVVLSRTHPLAATKTIKLIDLGSETLFLRPRKSGSGLHDKVLALYRAAGIKPRIVHTTLSPQFVGNTQVASGNGIYILPENVIKKNHDLAVVRLDEPNASREVHIAWRKEERSAHILQFIDTARELFQGQAREISSAASRRRQAKK